jgi:PDZ domain/Aspartyl protease
MNLPMLMLMLLAATAAGRPAAAAQCQWRPGESLRAEGEVRTGGLTGRFGRVVEIGTGRLRETTDLGIVTTRRGFDGQLAWTQDGSGGVHSLNASFARRLAVSRAWLDGRQGCPAAPGPTMRLLARREEGGRSFTAWQASPAGGAPFELRYDAASGRLDRALLQLPESRLIRHYSDWRDVGGGRLAAFAERDEYPEDEEVVEVRLVRAVLRPHAASSDFARPVPPDDVTMPPGRSSTSLPYQDDHGTRIYLPVYLNDQGPFLFELDNGGHNVVSAETARALGLSSTGSFSATGAGNAVAQTGIARISRMRIGDLMLRDQPVSIRSFSAASNDRSPNPPRAGILGLELFERLIVSIDRRRRVVTFGRFGTLPRPRGTALPLLFDEDAPLVAGSYGDRTGEFMLDTGNAGATIIEDHWAQANRLTDRLRRGIRRGDAIVSRSTIGIGPFSLAGEQVAYLGPAERGSEYTRATAGIYGEPLLSRFNAIYDYRRGRVWLDPIADAPALSPDRSGLTLAKGEGGVLRVTAVLPGSPADQAGLRVGDTLTAVNGAPVASLSRADAVHLLRGTPGARIEMTGMFGASPGARTIVLRDLVPVD